MEALTTHNNVINLGHRNHVCPHQHCSSAFGYKLVFTGPDIPSSIIRVSEGRDMLA
ncbi:hypothetical protein F4604DRAFT_1704758 [Suillus subluteus]|nr:hypothetical protein F4604DRAFT_1704758 [Suillus subluteus]